LRECIAAWSGIAASAFNHALLAEYRSGTQLGWHRDVAHFGCVVGVSLAGPARLRFRPYPPRAAQRKTRFALDLEPRSVYCLQGPARWDWQHAVSATKTLRYSITFRTLADERTRPDP
jgi:alkylated DNA repair dioxygenase AlkB